MRVKSNSKTIKKEGNEQKQTNKKKVKGTIKFESIN